GVDADEGDAPVAVVEDGRPHLAGVVQRLVIRLAVAAGRLRADLRRDVALGETYLESGFLGLCVAGADGKEKDGNGGAHGRFPRAVDVTRASYRGGGRETMCRLRLSASP